MYNRPSRFHISNYYIDFLLNSTNTIYNDITTMAAASSAAILNGLGSSFLSDGKRSRTLLSALIGGATVPAAPRWLVITAAVAPKKSWIPAVKSGGNLIDPKWLDGSTQSQGHSVLPDGIDRTSDSFVRNFKEMESVISQLYSRIHQV
ncbi:hypothetical protein L1887_07378 [Cichorium endivia]|nr:hypothetical protein L1887_07378 [Cichorium endivia]